MSKYIWLQYLTKKTASLAAMARISAHETTPGHWSSSSSLIASITSKPLRLKFPGESFSAVLSSVESIKTEPSHPYSTQKQTILMCYYCGILQYYVDAKLVCPLLKHMHHTTSSIVVNILATRNSWVATFTLWPFTIPRNKNTV